MRDYTYNNKEIELIKYIINNPPLRIWNDFVSYIFEYEYKYIGIYCESRQAASQNKFDEAIVSTIVLNECTFTPTEYMDLVCEKPKITEAYIARSFLYFTTYTKHNRTILFLKHLTYLIKKFFLFKNNPVEKLTLKTVGMHEEISCHPDSTETKSIDKKYVNLIDKGLLLKINDNYLPAYLNMNGYGFHITDKNFFHKRNELRHDFELLKLIKVE